MVILPIKIWVIWISRTFLGSVYLSICNFPYFLTDKQKTKKLREIQITQILFDSITISYIFCALVILKRCVFIGLSRKAREMASRWTKYIKIQFLNAYYKNRFEKGKKNRSAFFFKVLITFDIWLDIWLVSRLF